MATLLRSVYAPLRSALDARPLDEQRPAMLQTLAIRATALLARVWAFAKSRHLRPQAASVSALGSLLLSYFAPCSRARKRV